MADLAAYESVKDQVGCCGIWCGSCVVGNGALRELARRFESTLEAYGFRKWAPGDFDYAEFSKGLAAIGHLPLCPGCRKGGGREDCPLRGCAARRQLEGCTRCAEFAGCPHGELLADMRSGAAAGGLFVQAVEDERARFLAASEAALESRWPSSILFTTRPQAGR
jgi:hypothetical protein